MMPTTPNAERALRTILGAEIATHLAFLRDFGFGWPEIVVNDSLVMPALRATFLAATRELLMEVAFPNDDPRALQRHVMTAFLYRRPRHGQDDSLYVDWFAAARRPDIFDALERHAHEKRGLGDFVRAAVPQYAALFRDELRPVLAGESWESGDGDPKVVRALGFLQREHGFSMPRGHTHLSEESLVYTRGEATIRVAHLGGPNSIVTIEAGGKTHTGWEIPLADAVEFLQAHPEVFSGDFRAIRERQKGISARSGDSQPS